MSAQQAAPSLERLAELARNMQGERLPMLVDLVADRFLTGRATRISREAPVLILQQESEELLPGGGANAVANVHALGGVPLPVGVVGSDASGEALLRTFEERGIATSGLLRRAGYDTPTKTRILGGSRQSSKQQIVRIDSGDVLQLTDEDLQELAKRVDRLAEGARVAVVSDYGYGGVCPTLLPRLRRALARDGLLIGDSRHRLGELQGLDAATPNQEEAEDLVGGSLASSDEILQGGTRILKRLGGRCLLITLGSRGMALLENTPGEPRLTLLPVFGTDQVADVTGAGDTVIGTFGLALAAAASPLEASLLATFAAGLVVMKRGTATISAAELSEALSRGSELLERVRWDGS